MNGKSIIRNMLWRFSERCGAQIVNFIVLVVLARLLDPNVYGTIALIAVFANIMQVFVDAGLGNALIQKKDADDIDFSTVFISNLILCTISYLLLFILAPLIAQFYNDLNMVWMVRVLSLTILISGIKNVQQAYVSRNMLFKKFFFSTIGGTVISSVIGILMAFKGFGAWALVVQQVLNLFIDTTILWLTVKWRPKLLFSFERLRQLFSFGWKLLVSALLDSFYGNLASLIIGKKYSSANLAYYNQGQRFPVMIVTNINATIDSVLFPVMSNEQEDISHVKKITRHSLKVSIFIIAPLMVGLSACGESIVRVVLTDKWLQSVPFLQIFCISYMFWPVHTTNLNAIKALGRSDLFLKLEIIKKITGITLILIATNISVTAIAVSMLISSIIFQIVNAWPNKKLLYYGYSEQIKDIFPSIAIAIVMGGVIWILGKSLNLSLEIELIMQVVMGAIVYIGLAKSLKMEEYNYLQELLLSKTRRNKFETKK